MGLSLLATTDTQIIRLVEALYNQRPGYTYLSNFKVFEAENGAEALANSLGANFNSSSDAELAAIVSGNLGLEGEVATAANTYLEAQFAAYPSARGNVVLDAVTLLSGMEADPVFGAAAAAFNADVTASLVYSQVAANTEVTASDVAAEAALVIADAAAVEAGYTDAAAQVAAEAAAAEAAAAEEAAAAAAAAIGNTFTLTAGADVAGSSQASSSTLAVDFRFSDKNDTVNGDIGTIGGTDIFIDGSSTDNDTLNLSLIGNTGTFTSSNVETVALTMAAGAPVLDMTNLNSVATITVAGSVAGTIDEIATGTKQPAISLNDYTRVLTIEAETQSGTAALGTAETINVSLSGATWGTTAATQTGVTLTADGAGTLETLNITSAGDAANDFTLDVSTNVTGSTINVLGDQAMTLRAAAVDVTALTIAGTGAGALTLTVDNTGRTTTAINANNYTAVDNIAVKDSAAPAVGGDGASVTGIKSGQKVSFLDDFNATVLTFSAVTGSSDSATLVLDNETASTDTDIASIDVQNVETLNIESNGNVSTSTTVQNLIDSLTGDATTINVSGDTSIEIDLNIDATTAAGTRAVTVNGSTMTSFLVINEVASQAATATSKVSYAITGTDGNDTLVLNNTTGGSLVGGAGNDSLTGGTSNDTITGGAGIDTIVISTGTDTVTGGDGNDIYDINADGGVTAVAQVSETTDDAHNLTLATGDLYVVNIDGQEYQQIFNTSEDQTVADFVTAHAATILANHSITNTVDETDASDMLFTGQSDGTSFNITAAINDAGVVKNNVIVATTGATAGVTQATTITDFAIGDAIDTVGIAGLGTDYYEGAIGSATAATSYGVVVLTDVGYADFDLLEQAVSGRLTTDTEDGLLIFFNTTLGYAEGYYDSNTTADNNIDAADNMIDFTGITSLVELAETMSAASFTI